MQCLSCASLHRLSEVECNPDSVSGSGSPRLKLLEGESEMHIMIVVGWESVIVAKVLNILKGSVKNDMDSYASSRVHIPED